MINTRRNFIKNLAVGFIGSNILSFIPSNIHAQDSQKGIEIDKRYVVLDERTQKNMIALAEALLPGSQQINIGSKMMKSLTYDKGAASFFDAGIWNLEALSRARYKESFYKLTNKDDINTLLNHIERGNRVFYNNFRNLVFKIYYTDPVVWKRLSYNGPPQPNGFLNYAEPPQIAKK